MTEIVAAALPSVNCGSDLIMRAYSFIQLFGRASVHNGPVFLSSKDWSGLRETGRRHLKDVQPLPCMLQTLHPQRHSLHVHSVCDILTKTVTDFVTLCRCLMLRSNFNVLSDKNYVTL